MIVWAYCVPLFLLVGSLSLNVFTLLSLADDRDPKWQTLGTGLLAVVFWPFWLTILAISFYFARRG